MLLSDGKPRTSGADTVFKSFTYDPPASPADGPTIAQTGGVSTLGPVRYLDARDQAAFDAGHAPGAVRVPLDAWDAAAKSAATGFTTTAY